MAIYTTDFSEYTIGNPLSDWTDYWATGDFTFLAQANSGDYKVGTKECNYLVSASDRSVLTWDDIGSVADSDIIVKVNANSNTVGNGIRIYSRVSGSDGSENAYFLDIRDDEFALLKYVSGSATGLSTAVNFVFKDNTNYWVRFQTTGTTVRAKIWGEGAIEPTEWKISRTDSSLTSGYCGFGGYDASVDYEVDYFSCGTGVDSAVFPPAGWELSDKFGYVGGTDLIGSLSSTTRALGGLFDPVEDKNLTGIRINHNGHTTDIRVAVYSGGVLSTGLNNATLLHDFGKVASSSSPLELSCSAVSIPDNEPLWIIVKSSSTGTGFDINYTADEGNSGNYQIARGRCDVTSIIGSDSDVAFPATFADTSGTFSSNWYDWNILLEEVTQVETPVILPTSGAYPASQLISMSCSTSGANIYYTEDGSTPDVTDTLYSAPFALMSAKMIKAIGIKSGLTDSEIASETYTISTLVQQPIIFIIT